MIKDPLISIILVTYNAEEFLQRCLDSIYIQAYTPNEIIIIDGGSTDKSIEIIRDNADKIAFWKSEKDDGIYDAMNKALDYTQGQWIYFIGADDTLTPEFSELAKELKNADCIYYGSVYKAGKKYLGKLSRYHQAKTGINHQAIIYPSQIFADNRYDTSYKISADHVFNMGFNRHEKYHFEFKDFIIANFNDTGISSLQKDAVFESRKGRLIIKYFGLKIYLRFQFKKLKAKLFKS
ncbi:glycosyltransferase [Dyadobacter sp. CY356]|uniref:glycosyltransferase n=1 Tax=Dyadobacter sp. CY356 TaxID=2906442 RepID=UPI001F410A52|nr:glycosyltransferase [Dyadobacter sp. CY356]MCF0055937.1 glycosyltransferase [Dyadobacter sp. CY356]